MKHSSEESHAAAAAISSAEKFALAENEKATRAAHHPAAIGVDVRAGEMLFARIPWAQTHLQRCESGGRLLPWWPGKLHDRDT